MKIRAIAFNTFKEAIRDRILYVLLFFSVACIIFSRVLALLTVGDRVKVIKDVGLASISIFGVLIAILIGTGLVYKEIEKKTIYTLISKPIHRYQFLLGKFFGLALTLLIIISLMSLFFLALVFLHTFSVEWKLLLAIYFIYIELLFITAMSILFSCFSTPILSSIFSLSVYLIGHLSWGLEQFINKMPSGFAKCVTQFFYIFLPDLEKFNFRTEVVHNLPIPNEFFLYSTLYGLALTLFVLALATLIFRKRDFI
ncbi:MAG: ABC transporter permease [Candidatus Aminicenantaceae bacterium]